MEEKGEMRPR